MMQVSAPPQRQPPIQVTLTVQRLYPNFSGAIRQPNKGESAHHNGVDVITTASSCERVQQGAN